MKIGILTYHRTLNYGGCLQALATRLVLEQMGHEVYYVDYWPDYHKKQYAAFSWFKFWRGNYRYKIKYLLDCIHNYPFLRKRRRIFQVFLDTYIIPFCKPLDEHFDVVVYGSDQIWRKQDAIKTYNPMYFAKNSLNASKHVAFSASMGILPTSQEDKILVKQLVSNFDRIAVREQDLKHLLKELGYSDVIQTIDPTLLVDAAVWDKYIPQSPYTGHKYVLVYALHPEAFDMNHIRVFANKRGLQVKVLSGHATHFDTDTQISLAGPSEFLRLIKNAEVVFSSSFHGLAFSIIYHKEVYAAFSDNANRAKTLLDAVGIPERLIPIGSSIPEDFEKIDYSEVSKRLQQLRKSSIDYLSNIK